MYNKNKIKAWVRHSILIISAIALLLFLCASVFFWLITKHWYNFFIPTVFIYLIEWICRMIKLHQFQPPLFSMGYRYLKERIASARGTNDPQTDNIEPIETPKPIFKVNHISKWYLSDFVDCCFFDNYTCFGEYDTLILQQQFMIMYGAYSEAKRDSFLTEQAKLKNQILIIEFKWEVIRILSTMLLEIFLEPTAVILREWYPMYAFTKDSWADDLKKVNIGEIATKIKYERLIEQLAQLEKNNAPAKETSKETALQNFYTTKARIEKFQGVGYDMNTISMLEFAVLENELTEEYERLLEQQRKSGN